MGMFDSDKVEGGMVVAAPNQWLKDRILLGLCGIVAIIASFLALKGWHGSLMEFYAFRQTQTAISVQYLLKGGHFLQYETPVLGPPWSIPMEFPLYQYLVFLLVKATGYPLDQAGRLVSLLCFIGAFYPLYGLMKSYFGARAQGLIVLSLFCLSPLYLYWSRTFMIESTALASSLWYLYFINKYTKRDNSSAASYLLPLLILCFATISSITKVTTFFGYYLLAILLVLSHVTQAYRTDSLAEVLKRNFLLLLAGFILPLIAIFIWTRFSDTVKSLNPVGSMLTSSNLKDWNFGSWQQKFSLATWKTILSRSINDLLGDLRLMLLFLLLPFCRKKTIYVSLLLLLLFLVPIGVFTNLYFVHNYYAYANGIMLLAALALLIGDIGTRGTAGYLLSLTILVVICTVCIRSYININLPVQGTQFRYQQLKTSVDIHTQPDDILVYFGADWSSEMPYYVNRRASMFPDSLTNADNFRQAVVNLRSYRIGGVVFCGGTREAIEEQNRVVMILNLPADGSTVPVEDCVAYFPYKS